MDKVAVVTITTKKVVELETKDSQGKPHRKTFSASCEQSLFRDNDCKFFLGDNMFDVKPVSEDYAESLVRGLYIKKKWSGGRFAIRKFLTTNTVK